VTSVAIKARIDVETRSLPLPVLTSSPCVLVHLSKLPTVADRTGRIKKCRELGSPEYVLRETRKRLRKKSELRVQASACVLTMTQPEG
jgi:hypothetical protein